MEARRAELGTHHMGVPLLSQLHGRSADVAASSVNHVSDLLDAKNIERTLQLNLTGISLCCSSCGAPACRSYCKAL